MADDATMRLVIEAQTRQFTRALREMEQRTQSASTSVEKRVKEMSDRLPAQVKEGIDRVNNHLAALGIGGALSTAGIVAFGEQWLKLGNLIAASGVGQQEIDALRANISALAVRSGVDMQIIGAAFKDVFQASRELGTSQGETIALIETLTSAFKSEAMSADETSSAVQRFGESLKFGSREASDYLEVFQQSPRLADAVAKQFRMATSEFVTMVEENETTVGKLQKAILAAKPALDAQAFAAAPTISGALARVSASLQDYVNKSGFAAQASGTAAQMIATFANELPNLAGHVEKVGTAIAVVLVGAGILPMVAAIGGPAIAAIAGFTASIQTLGVAVASAAAAKGILAGAVGLLVSPVGLVVTAVAGLTAALYFLEAQQSPAIVAMDKHRAAAKQFEDAVNTLSSAIPGAQQRLEELGRHHIATAKAALDHAQAELTAADAIRQAANAGALSDPMGSGLGAAIQNAAALSEDGYKRIRKAVDDARVALNEAQTVVATSPLRDSRIDAGKVLRSTPDSESGSAARRDQIEKLFADKERAIRLQEAEITAIGRTTAEREREKTMIELTSRAEQIAKEQGASLTDEQREKIRQLADAWSEAAQRVENARAAYQNMQELQRFAGQQVSSFFSDVVSGGKNAEQAIMNLTKRLADMAIQAVVLGEGPLASLFGTKSSIQGGVGGLIGGLFGGGSSIAGNATLASGFGLFDSGGYTGRGSSTGVAGLVHGQEFVINAQATKRFYPLLEAINSNRLPGYASGGFVGSAPSGAAGLGGGVSINIVNNSKAQISQSESSSSDGKTYEILIEDVVVGKMRNTGSNLHGAMKNLGAVRQPLVRR